MKYFVLLFVITLCATSVGYVTRDIHLIGEGLGLFSCFLAGLVFLFIIILVIRKDEFSGAVLVFYTFLSFGLAMIFSPLVDDYLENRMAHEQVDRIYAFKLKTGSFPEKWECEELESFEYSKRDSSFNIHFREDDWMFHGYSSETEQWRSWD